MTVLEAANLAFFVLALFVLVWWMLGEDRGL